MGTTRAARALGLGGVAGSLSPGKAADVIAFSGSFTGAPLEQILTEPWPVATVWIAGKLRAFLQERGRANA
jgi:imidazolonepropionase-like amidohydrolase